MKGKVIKGKYVGEIVEIVKIDNEKGEILANFTGETAEWFKASASAFLWPDAPHMDFSISDIEILA